MISVLNKYLLMSLYYPHLECDLRFASRPNDKGNNVVLASLSVYKDKRVNKLYRNNINKIKKI